MLAILGLVRRPSFFLLTMWEGEGGTLESASESGEGARGKGVDRIGGGGQQSGCNGRERAWTRAGRWRLSLMYICMQCAYRETGTCLLSPLLSRSERSLFPDLGLL